MGSKSKLASNRSPNWAFMEKFVVPHYDDPVDYLVRWRIVQTPWFGLYLHKLGSPDPRDTLHNHPWTFLSFVLRGGYIEQTQFNGDCKVCDNIGEIYTMQATPDMDDTVAPCSACYSKPRHIKRINLKRLKDWHWIESLDKTPTWTLMFVGRRKRVWQYMDRDGTLTDYDHHRFNDDFYLALARRAQREQAQQS